MSTLAHALIRPARFKRRDAGLGGSGLTLQTAFGGMFADELGQTAAGKIVTVEKALGLAAVGAAVRVISGNAGTMPLQTFVGEGAGRQPAFAEPTALLLRRRPNPQMSAEVLWTLVFRHLVSWGNAYLGKERVGNQVVALWPIRPDYVQVVVESNPVRKIFRVATPGGMVRDWPQEDIIHVLGHSDDGWRGVSPIHQHRQAVGFGLALEEYGAKAIANRAVPTGVLRIKKALKDAGAKKRLRAEWEDLYKTSAQSHRIAILDEDAEFQAVSMPLADAQYVEQRKLGVQEIARIFNLPTSKLQGSSGDSLTYKTQESNQTEFVLDALRPPIAYVEGALNSDPELFPPDTRGGRRACRFRFEELLRADTFTRARANALATAGAPWMTGADVREHEDLAPDKRFDEVAPPNAPSVGGGSGSGES